MKGVVGVTVPRLLRVFLFGSLFAGFSLVMLAIGLVFKSVYDQPTYDERDPDYLRVSVSLKEAKTLLDARGPTEADGIDLSMLNGGRWNSACVFGGYGDPLVMVDKLGAAVSGQDRSRLMEARSMGFRIAAIEESEAMIAYVDPSNTAHFIHFPDGLGESGQHFARCITKPETRVPLGP